MERKRKRTMIKLEKIVKNDNLIVCDAFVEDCDKPIHLSLDVNNKEFEKFSFPKNYEWCTSHISKAKWFLLSLIGMSEIPREKIIMWY